MFDKLISNVLNKFLGTYIENLDGSNLKLSLWSGNAELYHLDIKQSALEDLDLPIAPVYGHLEHLRLVIPWNQLFSGVWEAHITGVFLLVTPNTSVDYDATKEEKLSEQVKQAALEKIEEARLKALEAKKAAKSEAQSSDDTYVEKLVAQIIRNIQVSIKNVHIRYEDSISIPSNPFSFGFSMSELSVVSTDKDYKACLDTDRLVYKLLSLDGLGMYWQPNSRILSQENLNNDKLREILTNSIDSGSSPPLSDNIEKNTESNSLIAETEFILSPLCLEAQLQLNPHPYNDTPEPFSVPKLSLNVILHSLGLNLSRCQYAGIMGLVESVDRMRLSSLYRKHRPSVTGYTGNAADWWQYAFNCHLENIQRVKRNWSWDNIKNHRETCRTYKLLYKAWLDSGQTDAKKSPELLNCERYLDVFNITLVRQQAKLEYDRENKLKGSSNQKTQNSGWLGGWFGWGAKPSGATADSSSTEEQGIPHDVTDLANRMSPEEKSELYNAIGYTEEETPATLPLNYQDIKLTFLLSNMTFKIRDNNLAALEILNQSLITVMDAQLQGLKIDFTYRTAADALKLQCNLGRFIIHGIKSMDVGTSCKLVDSLENNSACDLVELRYETKPLDISDLEFDSCSDDQKCDEVLILNARPLQLVFHAATVVRLVNLLAPPQTLSLQQLQAAALNQIEVVKQKSVSGLQAAIESNTRRYIRMTVMPSRLVLPESGELTESCCVLVMSLGALKIVSNWAEVCGSEHEDSVLSDSEDSKKSDKYYDRYIVSLTDVQMLVCSHTESWEEALETSFEDSANLPSKEASQYFSTTSLLPSASSIPRPSSLPVGSPSRNTPSSVSATKYLLPPTHLHVDLMILATSIDPTLAKHKIDATLPLLKLTLSDDRLTQLAHVLNSVSKACESIVTEKDFVDETDMNMNFIDSEGNAQAAAVNMIPSLDVSADGEHSANSSVYGSAENISESPQYTLLQMKFDVPEVSLVLVTCDENSITPQLSLSAQMLGGEIIQRTYDTKVSLFLQHFTVKKLGLHCVEIVSTRFKNTSEFTMSSCDTTDTSSDWTLSTPSSEFNMFENKPENVLLHLTYKMISEDSPDFKTIYQSTQQMMTVNMASLSLHFEHRAISTLINVFNSIQYKLDSLKADSAKSSPGDIPLTKKDSSISTSAKTAPLMNKNVSRTKDKSDVTFLRLRAKMEQVSFSLSDGERQVAYAHITGLSVNIKQDSSKMSIHSKLADIGVTNPNPSTIHHDLVKVEDRSAFDFTVELYNNDDETEKLHDPTVDFKIVLIMGKTRLLYINSFIADVLSWVSQIQSAGSVMTNASQIAAEAAKANLTEMVDKQPKVLLDLTIKAPIVYIPESSTSPHGLLINLGQLRVSNKFEFSADCRNSLGHAAETDNMSMTLSDVKVAVVDNISQNSCVVVKDELSEEVPSVPLLSPITFSVNVVRNLSSDWLLSQPMVSVTATLLPIKMRLKEEDIRMVMSLLQNNIGEGATEEQPNAEVAKVSKRKRHIGGGLGGLTIVEDESGGVEVKRDKASLTFTVEEISLELYQDHQTVQGESVPLAELTLHTSVLCITAQTDGVVSAEITVQDCTLHDTRLYPEVEHKERIRKLLKRKRVEASAPAMLMMRMMRKGDGELEVDMKISSFLLVLNLPYILRLQSFFLDNISSNESKGIIREQSVPNATVARSEVKETQDSSQDISGLINVTITLEQPDIALVHDMFDIDTPAIFLHGAIKSDVKLCQDRRNITCSLENLQLYTCVYNENKRKQSMSQIMSSCTVDILDSATTNHADSVRVQVGQVDFRCTPDTIELVTLVLQSLSSLEDTNPSSGATVATEGGDTLSEDLSSVWLPKPFNLSVLPGFPVEEASEVLAGSPAVEVEARSGRSVSSSSKHSAGAAVGSETASIECTLVTVTFETGKGSTSIPLVKVQMRANATVTGFLSPTLSTSGEVTVECAYFNPSRGMWEPLLEPMPRVTGEGLQHSPVRVGVEGQMDMRASAPSTGGRRGSNFSEASAISPTSSVTSIEKDFALDYERVDAVPPPVMSFSIDVKDPLEFTVSRSFLDVWTNLSESYLAAYLSKGHDAVSQPLPPYSFTNQTGYTTVLQLKDSNLLLHPPNDFGRYNQSNQSHVQGLEVCVQSGANVALYDSCVLTSQHKRRVSLVHQYEVRNNFLHVRIPELASSKIQIPLNKACKRFYPVSGIGDTMKQTGGIVSSVKPKNTTREITLSSCVEVTNSLKETLELYFMTERGNEVELVQRLESGTTCNLPLRAVHTPSAELFFCISGYSVSRTPLVWKGLQNNPQRLQELSCAPKNNPGDTNRQEYNFTASCQVDQILWGYTSRHTLDSIEVKVELRPKLQIHNLLPLPIVVSPPNSSTRTKVEPSELLELPHAELGAMYIEIELLAYFGRNWKCGKTIERNPVELSVWTFNGSTSGGSYSSDGNTPTLELGVHTTSLKGTVTMGLYCPFWMVNKTGLDLTYRKSFKPQRTASVSSTSTVDGDDVSPPLSPLPAGDASSSLGEVPSNFISHSRTNSDPVLFSFRSKAFFGKKKASVRAEDSSWSEKFALDVVGSSGIVTCKSVNSTTGMERIYQLNVSISLSANALTKVVVLTPFYKVVNNAPYTLVLQHVDQHTWFRLKSGQCVGLWPDTNKKAVLVRVENSNKSTTPISYDFLHSTLFRLDNQYGGVHAEAVEEDNGGGILLTLDKYREYTAAALLINQLLQVPITVWQEDHPDDKSVLLPGEMMQYGWSEAMEQPQLCVQCGEEAPFTKSMSVGITSLPQFGGVADLYNGGQRCLVFSEDLSLLESLVKDEWLGRTQMEYTVSLSSCGLSLVDDVKGKEVMYAAISSSGVVWESRKYGGRKRRPFSVAQTELIEAAYQRHKMRLENNPNCPAMSVKINDNLEVDFHRMSVKRPFNRHLHRTYEPGSWLQLQMYERRRHLHFKVNKLQVDNQLNDVLFPVVFSRVNPGKSIMAETVPKPLFEVSIIQVENTSGLVEYKYLSALLQEFHVMVELPFISAVLSILYGNSTHEQQLLYNLEKFKQDELLVRSSLSESVSLRRSSQLMFFHYMHLSPIKMHLSFSLTGLDSESNAGGGVAALGGQVLHLFLESVGVTLTEMQDIEFKMGYFERKEQWNSWESLMGSITRHYSAQVLSQLYVVVLGLDLLGNPFSFVVGVTRGMGDLFYEPIQGAVEGPGEFAEGLVLGARSFVGKTVGGLAGVASRITGTIGKGVATLTLDENYQRRRREQQLHKPADGLETMARGVKGLGSGVFDGVTGVFTKPVTGAMEQGVEGFFKGVGKGVVGLVTRPASGVIDFASGSFGAVKMATEGVDSINRQRPSRHIGTDGVIAPYCKHTAEGHNLLLVVEKGRYSSTDSYVSHSPTEDLKAVLIATDNRLLFVSKNELMGVWRVEWQHCYEELTDPPLPTPRGLRVNVRQDKKRVMMVFGGGSNSKEVHANGSDPRVQTSASTSWRRLGLAFTAFGTNIAKVANGSQQSTSVANGSQQRSTSVTSAGGDDWEVVGPEAAPPSEYIFMDQPGVFFISIPLEDEETQWFILMAKKAYEAAKSNA